MKQSYLTPAIQQRRVILEKSVAANTSAYLGGSGAGVTQNAWEDTPTPAPAETDIVITL
jgi:hypothetical protein